MGRYRFGSRSLSNVRTCHPVLQEVLHEAILRTPMDFTVLEGHRGEDEQNRMVERGVSQLRYPRSKHNRTDADGEPRSWAADIAPWWHETPHIRWDRTDEFRWLAGFVMGVGARIAEPKGFRLRWGGNWDSDGDHGDSSFVDLPHIELVDIGEDG